jgi:hypothetical protein
MSDNLQQQRFELKYIIPDSLALAARDFVRSYLVVDEFGAQQPNLSYPVHSLYLDSPDYALHQSTINGDKNRYKLRIRFYENRPGAPVYFEIKSRMDNTISKQRGAVKREAVDSILAGHLPDSHQMAPEDPKQLVALQQFSRHLNNLRAAPRVHVAYLREAWLTPHDNSVRVTFDRQVRSCPEPTARLVAEMENPIYVFGDAVVLELKFTGRFPHWFGDLVRVFGLRQTSAAKYVDGIVLMEEKHTLRDPFTQISASSCPDRLRERKNRLSSGNLSRFIRLPS